MSMDPNRWVKTVPFIGTKSNQEEYKLDSSRWVNTLPRIDDNTLVLSDEINSNPKSSSGKKYSLIIIVFVVGLILVSVIKNGTRNLQKDISNLKASVNVLKFDLHHTILEHEVITSPENISRLAKEYLEPDFAFYKKSQVRQLNEKLKISAQSKEKKYQNTFKKKNKIKTDEIKLRIAKKIVITKTELKKLQELYTTPERLPKEIRLQISKKIRTTKNQLKELYSDPYGTVLSKKAARWTGLQIVKVFLGMPVIPGK